MNDDEQMRRLFERLEFADEPPMETMPAEYAARGQRRLRLRRTAGWTGGVAGMVAVATGVAVALPGNGADPGQQLDVAGRGEAPVVQNTPEPADTEPVEPRWEDEHRISFPATRQLLLDTAVEHFDPARTHLPDDSTNGGTGGGSDGAWRVSSKLAWTIPGETGMGMVQVAVTTPGFASSDAYARSDVATMIGCEPIDDCTEQTVPGTGETVLVAAAKPDMNLLFGVMYERSDGSLAGVGVYDLFGNNSLDPVSEVDVSLEQAFAFVTDPDLKVDSNEALEEAERERDWIDDSLTEPTLEPDFSSTETAPAPPAEGMSQAAQQQALQKCTEGTDGAWDRFEAVLGVRADVDVEPPAPVGWVIARDGDDRLLCQLDSAGRALGAMMFGSTAAKDSPYLITPVEAKAAGFGMYIGGIARVTVQTSGGPEQDAITRDGYWFLPLSETYPAALALRGYDATGELVYDSTTDNPGPETCFTDPDGEEVIRLGTVDDPAPETCQRAFEWGH